MMRWVLSCLKCDAVCPDIKSGKNHGKGRWEALTKQPAVLVAPVGVVREGDVHKFLMTIVAKNWRSEGSRARLYSEHAGEV